MNIESIIIGVLVAMYVRAKGRPFWHVVPWILGLTMLRSVF